VLRATNERKAPRASRWRGTQAHEAHRLGEAAQGGAVFDDVAPDHTLVKFKPA